MSLVKFVSHALIATILCACSNGHLQAASQKTTPQQMGSVKLLNKRVPNDLIGDNDKLKDLYFANLIVLDFPIGKEIVFSTKRVLQKDPEAYTKQYSFIVDKNGMPISPGGEQVEFLLSSYGYASGERLNIRFESKDGTMRNDFSYIPRPIRVNSSDNKWQAEVEMLTTEMFILKVNGLNESETCKFFTKSCEEEICNDFKYEEESNFIIIMPAVIGKTGGTCIFKLERTDGSIVEGSFPWGTEIKV